jgi:hypothetical protein
VTAACQRIAQQHAAERIAQLQRLHATTHAPHDAHHGGAATGAIGGPRSHPVPHRVASTQFVRPTAHPQPLAAQNSTIRPHATASPHGRPEMLMQALRAHALHTAARS